MILSTSKASPITPVCAIRTSSSLILRIKANLEMIFSTANLPACPVKTLALPALIIIARALFFLIFFFAPFDGSRSSCRLCKNTSHSSIFAKCYQE